MIVGLGIDIVNIDRIAALLDSAGDRFMKRTFAQYEISSAENYSKGNMKALYAHFAKRFAAKEAFAKAVGCGFGKNISFCDVWVENDSLGKPLLVLSDRAQELVGALTNGEEFFCHLSLSDDLPYAVASVVIERRKDV